jgi:hypothetical protein
MLQAACLGRSRVEPSAEIPVARNVSANAKPLEFVGPSTAGFHSRHGLQLAETPTQRREIEAISTPGPHNAYESLTRREKLQKLEALDDLENRLTTWGHQAGTRWSWVESWPPVPCDPSKSTVSPQ